MTSCKLHIFDKDYDDNKKSDKNNLDNNNLKKWYRLYLYTIRCVLAKSVIIKVTVSWQTEGPLKGISSSFYPCKASNEHVNKSVNKNLIKDLPIVHTPS